MEPTRPLWKEANSTSLLKGLYIRSINKAYVPRYYTNFLKLFQDLCIVNVNAWRVLSTL